MSASLPARIGEVDMVSVGSYQMLSQDLLISVCTIIEGAPRVDAQGRFSIL